MATFDTDSKLVEGYQYGFSTDVETDEMPKGLNEDIEIGPGTSRTDVITAIWQVRKREIFLFELLERFSRQHNIRDLYPAFIIQFYKMIPVKIIPRKKNISYGF